MRKESIDTTRRRPNPSSTARFTLWVRQENARLSQPTGSCGRSARRGFPEAAMACNLGDGAEREAADVEHRLGESRLRVGVAELVRRRSDIRRSRTMSAPRRGRDMVGRAGARDGPQARLRLDAGRDDRGGEGELERLPDEVEDAHRCARADRVK